MRGNKGKPCFRRIRGRSVNGACPPHHVTPAVHRRWSTDPSHDLSTTALRADSDRLHKHQDRRTT